jgi:arsenate reductase (thioredoxin)
MSKKKVLILCTGNSCRSLMAEAMINHFLGDSWEAFSAGIAPTFPNPRALQVLREIGVSTEGLRSKSVDEFVGRDDLDVVITVCDHANESCPFFPGKVKRLHLSLIDPAPYTDQPDEVALPVFRSVQSAIREQLFPLLQSML